MVLPTQNFPLLSNDVREKSFSVQFQMSTTINLRLHIDRGKNTLAFHFDCAYICFYVCVFLYLCALAFCKTIFGLVEKRKTFLVRTFNFVGKNFDVPGFILNNSVHWNENFRIYWCTCCRNVYKSRSVCFLSFFLFFPFILSIWLWFFFFFRKWINK